MKNRRILNAAMVTVLAVALVAPSAAFAAELSGQGAGNGAGRGPRKGAGLGQQSQTQAQDRRLAQLQLRIERTLKQRKAKFDRVEARLKKRLERLNQLADKAAASGVDVSAARVALSTAAGQLALAATEELKAQEMFTSVLQASDKRAAFAAARAQAKTAQKALQRARLEVVNALRVLRTAIDAAGTTTP
jgi:predicted phage tail protein